MADKYKLIKKIGKGSYGSAYLAHNRTDSSCQVVIKRVSLRGLSSKDVDESMKEAQVLRMLDHPCIIKHIEHFKDEDNLCIVTELAENGDLQSKVKGAKANGRLFREETIWQWFIQLCCAIKHVHDRKILHRDIKTANIFLSGGKDGDDPMVKLGDFGISKILENTADCAKTAVGTVVRFTLTNLSMMFPYFLLSSISNGTSALTCECRRQPYYMSPELCESKPYNYKSDIWALGCVLYEVATLKQPFDAANFNSLCIKILRGKYSPLPDAYSSDLRQIVGLLLERDPEKRPDINFLLSIRPLRIRLSSFSKLHPIVLQNEFAHTALHGFNAKQAVSQSKYNAANADFKPVKHTMGLPAKAYAVGAAPSTPSAVCRSAVVIDRGLSPPAPPRSPPIATSQYSPSQVNPKISALSPRGVQCLQQMASPRVHPSTPRGDAGAPPKGGALHQNQVVSGAGREDNKDGNRVETEVAGQVGYGRIQVPRQAEKVSTPVCPQQAPKSANIFSTPDSSPEKECLQQDKIMWNGQTLRLPGVGTKDSRHSRIESLRVFLEANIGAQQFLSAYRLMESVSEDDDEQVLLQFVVLCHEAPDLPRTETGDPTSGHCWSGQG